ncbi:MAG: YHYH protein [Chloroflexaceae bacterium]|jgi:hypothetical protein|nr:YHYH protein [Chloroflexaceae bacterium]
MLLTRRAFISVVGISLGLTACQLRPPPARRDQPNATPVPPVASQVVVTHTPANHAAVTQQVAAQYSFAAFASRVRTHHDEHTLYIESDGMPDHPMMIGIRSWQQQVPIPQDYTGSNAWQLPRQPQIAETPISAKSALYRGAIAIAANGVPIFNALNNRGEDALLAGELDEWGGHCGQGDDYHYHVAPLHLQAIVGATNPIAYALDGFPIYGNTEPDGSPMQALDEFNGHYDASGNYHYHGTTTYPYINGGLRGTVVVRDDQIEPQPHIHPVRPPQQPLPGAVITDFHIVSEQSYVLTYTRDGATHTVEYTRNGDTYTFVFSDASGTRTSESYRMPPP